jgi:hypothetical protein
MVLASMADLARLGTLLAERSPLPPQVTPLALLTVVRRRLDTLATVLAAHPPREQADATATDRPRGAPNPEQGATPERGRDVQ